MNREGYQEEVIKLASGSVMTSLVFPSLRCRLVVKGLLKGKEKMVDLVQMFESSR